MAKCVDTHNPVSLENFHDEEEAKTFAHVLNQAAKYRQLTHGHLQAWFVGKAYKRNCHKNAKKALFNYDLVSYKCDSCGKTLFCSCDQFNSKAICGKCEIVKTLS